MDYDKHQPYGLPIEIAYYGRWYFQDNFIYDKGERLRPGGYSRTKQG